MKKIIIALFTFFPIFAYGENMCVKDGSIMVVLDPQIAGTALSNNMTGKTWSTRFSYGVVSGIGGCHTNVGSTEGEIASNQTDITPYNKDRSSCFCYCKMLRPVESMWVYSGYQSCSTNGVDTYCTLNCASQCSSKMASTPAIRTGLFGNPVQ